MWKYQNTDELYHWGVLGMRWGHRKAKDSKPALGGYGRRIARLHAGPSITIGTKRQLARDKNDLKYMNNGGHLSFALRRKKQAQLDARDKRLLKERIKKNQNKLNKLSSDYKTAQRLRKKKLSEMSNDEIRTLNQRRQLESDYTRLNKATVAKGIAIVGATAGLTTSILTLKKNAPALIKVGKEAVDKVKTFMK